MQKRIADMLQAGDDGVWSRDPRASRLELASKTYRRYVFKNKVYRLKPAWLLGSGPIRYEITLFF
jgi:hypothetical protein